MRVPYFTTESFEGKSALECAHMVNGRLIESARSQHHRRVENNITHGDLNEVKELLSLEQLKEQDRKANDIIGTVHLSGYAERLLATQFFKLGLLAAKISYDK